MPLTFKCLENNNGIDQRVTKLVLPLGAATLLQGSAVNNSVATLFICWTIGKHLSVVDIVIIRQVSYS